MEAFSLAISLERLCAIGHSADQFWCNGFDLRAFVGKSMAKAIERMFENLTKASLRLSEIEVQSKDQRSIFTNSTKTIG